MTVIVKFEDNDHEYSVDFIKLASKLGITESQVVAAVDELIRKS